MIDISKYGYSILQIETYSACNMKCEFCPYPLRIDKESLLDEDIVYSLLDSVDPASPGFEYLTFSQFNEPLMDPRIFEFYKRANALGFKQLAITNGLLLNSPKIRRQLLDSPIDLLKISLQTVDPKRFSKQRGVSITPQRYFRTLAKYLSEVDSSRTQVSLDIACNFLNPFKSTLKKVVGISPGELSVVDSKRNLKNNLIQFLHYLTEFDSQIRVDPLEVSSLISNFSSNYKRSPKLELKPGVFIHLKQFFHGRRISDYHEYTGSIRCNNRILGILADGTLAPCCLSYDPDLSLGNLNTSSLDEILRSKASWLSNLRDYSPLESSVCQRCMGEPTTRGLLYKRFFSAAREAKLKLLSNS